jgi:hypothetical protein
LHTICNAAETLKGEMKILLPGCSFEISFNSLKAKPAFIAASFC